MSADEQRTIDELRSQRELGELPQDLEARLHELYADLPAATPVIRPRRTRWPAVTGIAAAVAALAVASTILVRAGDSDLAAPPAPSAGGSVTSTSPTSRSLSDAPPSSVGAPSEVIDSGPYQGYRRVGGISVSWAVHYDTVQELAEASDLIVVGTIRGRSTAVPQAASTVTWDLAITATLKGSASAPGEVVVGQTGSLDTVAKTLVEVDDDPLFAAGDSVLLFLKRGAPGRYRVSAGPQGRFVVTDGRVSAYSGFGFGAVQNLPLTDFRRLLDRDAGGSAPSTEPRPYSAATACGQQWAGIAIDTQLLTEVTWPDRFSSSGSTRMTIDFRNLTRSTVEGTLAAEVVLRDTQGLVVASLSAAGNGTTVQITPGDSATQQIDIPAAARCATAIGGPLPPGSYTATLIVWLSNSPAAVVSKPMRIAVAG